MFIELAEIIRIEIVLCYAMKALWELDERKLVTCFVVHEKAHCFMKRLGIVGVHITIKSENEGGLLITPDTLIYPHYKQNCCKIR